MRRSVALGAAGFALVAATAGGVAFAADSGGSTPAPAVTTATSTTPPEHPKAGHRQRSLAARALHGTFTVQRKSGPAVVDVQRGQVTRSDAGSVTVRSTDGFEATYGIDPATRVRKDKKPAAIAALTTGAKVNVLAADAGGHPVARVIRVAG
jgi:hypothetical protein